MATIQFCETVIANAIEKATKEGRSYVFPLIDDDELLRYGDTNEYGIARLVWKERRKYANHKPSYHACGREIIPEVMIEYLRAHGYTVNIYQSNFQCYGYGWKRGYKIAISW